MLFVDTQIESHVRRLKECQAQHSAVSRDFTKLFYALFPLELAVTR